MAIFSIAAWHVYYYYLPKSTRKTAFVIKCFVFVRHIIISWSTKVIELVYKCVYVGYSYVFNQIILLVWITFLQSVGRVNLITLWYDQGCFIIGWFLPYETCTSYLVQKLENCWEELILPSGCVTAHRCLL